MKRALLVMMVGALYLLHQDFWFWRAATPLVFGFIPIGLFYHACYTIAVSLAIWVLVRQAWPSHLETELQDADSSSERDRRPAAAPGIAVADHKEGVES